MLIKKEEKEIQEREYVKRPRDVSEWFEQIWDEPPQLDQDMMGTSTATIDHYLDGAGHFGGLLLKDAKFVTHYWQRPSVELGLRAMNSQLT